MHRFLRPGAEREPESAERRPGPAGETGALDAGIAGAATRGDLTPELLLELQRHAGNRRVQRALLQRQSDAGVMTPIAGVPEPTPEPTPEPKPEFSFTKMAAPGPRFDSEYVPVGPVPAVGSLNVTLWVHITFNDFTRAMMRQPDFRGHRFTREQMADFKWKDDEKAAFETGFMTSVMGAWSGKHTMHLSDPDFAEYRTSVNITVATISDPSTAHMKITAQKVPRGAPRFRSFVAGDTATLDIRDPSEPESSRVFDRTIIEQVGAFDKDSAELSPSIQAQVRSLVDRMRPLQSPAETDKLLSSSMAANFRGRSSSAGSREHNEKLGLARANAVANQIAADLGRPGVPLRTSSVGEQNASEDPSFQRVDVAVYKTVPGSPDDRVDVTQNVAAHEAGHMFGLGDEYVEEAPGPGVLPKFYGDKPEHYGDVEALMGTEAADDLLVANSGSMMSAGSDVKKGHYVYFLQALNDLTGKRWTVE